MQALTPLLFSMLFPRFSSSKAGNGAERYPDADDQSLPHESLLGARHSISNEMTFEEGYPVQEQYHHQTSKARRHHSTDSTLALNGGTPRRSDAKTRTPGGNNSFVSSNYSNTNNNADHEPLSSNLSRRSGTFPPQGGRRAARPKRLSLDHASYIATYPSLDGLGDLGRTSSLEYFRDPAAPRRANSGGSRLRSSQETMTMPSSRTSTSSISSMVSDASSSTVSSSCSSVREPLTPTTRSPNYKSILSLETSGSNQKKQRSAVSRKSVQMAMVDDILGDNQESSTVHTGNLCLSPQSNNFFGDESSQFSSMVESTTTGGPEARGRRQLTAH
ncbi:hypothetical protein EMPS_05337 [Entomortierella parvispora]|uniref:Sox C-terminal domain-containing protein n=1 Tax=Entomortierella parvispora TaxID=205924 RepID=A0A9P3HAA0_9FUNG|nr:hypothetical protein EMPS_05337 [Entomortierella parvispora]